MRRTLVVVLALLLVVAGMGSAYGVYQQMRGNIVAQHSEQLSDVVYSLDRSAQNRFETYRQALEYATGRESFMRAEAVWVQTGVSADLLYRMEESLLVQEMDVSALVAVNNGAVLSTSGADYSLPNPLTDMFICADAAGKSYLGIACAGDSVDYAVLIDLDVLCARLVEGCAVNSGCSAKTTSFSPVPPARPPCAFPEATAR